MQDWLNDIKYYFGKPYEDNVNDYVIKNGIIIYRPNHGIAQHF